MPTVDWVLPGFGESNKGRILAAFTAACLQTHLASRRETRATTIIIMIIESEVLAQQHSIETSASLYI
jgi:hypothetical protein